jgi:hypothetical protein
MWKDPIVEETRRLREELARSFNNDPEAIFRYIREEQRKSKRKVVSRQPRIPRVRKDAT